MRVPFLFSASLEGGSHRWPPVFLFRMVNKGVAWASVSC